MHKHRMNKLWIGLAAAILIPMLGFLSTVEQPVLTGYATYEGSVEGPEFTAAVGKQVYVYRFMEGYWFESKDREEWEYRPDMGSTVLEGLVYLRSYGAVVYYDGEVIEDMYDFTRRWK